MQVSEETYQKDQQRETCNWGWSEIKMMIEWQMVQDVKEPNKGKWKGEVISLQGKMVAQRNTKEKE